MTDQPDTHRVRPDIDEPAGATRDPSQGSVIRYLRRQLGMTQEDLAHALGITVGTVSRWEKGRFRPSRLARTLILDFARSHNIPLNLSQLPKHG